MRGFDFRSTANSYFPQGRETEKVASLGYGNRWVKVTTAVNGDANPILLVNTNEFLPADGKPEGLTLTFDGKRYAFDRFDAATDRNIYQQVDTLSEDIHEGREIVGQVGNFGPAIITNTNTGPKYTASNWPDGGDSPDNGNEAVVATIQANGIYDN